ncbi:MAG: hypothetical protein CMJ50_00200 [Planctomycetaceae bacterium]|nr:hypothetical protein [Planctomycetaceae bacterium]
MSDSNGKDVEQGEPEFQVTVDRKPRSASIFRVRVWSGDGDELRYQADEKLGSASQREQAAGKIREEFLAVDQSKLAEQLFEDFKRLEQGAETANGDEDDNSIEVEELTDESHFCQMFLGDGTTAISYRWAIEGRDGRPVYDRFWAITSPDGTRTTKRVDQLFTDSNDNEVTVNCPVRQPDSCPPNVRWEWADRQNWLKSGESPTTVECLQSLRELLAAHVDFGSEQTRRIGFVSAWIMSTYYYRGLRSFPYLHFQGPRGSGKTQVLNVINLTAFAPIMTAETSKSALFRTIAETGGTLIIDEAERIAADSELAPVLNAGYLAGARVSRTEKDANDQFHPKSFDVYSPKALASINDLAPATADRSIRFSMLRADSRQTYPEPDPNEAVWGDIRGMLYRWALKNAQDLIAQTPEIELPRVVANREHQKWRPIAAVLMMACRESGAGTEPVSGWIESHVVMQKSQSDAESISEMQQLVLTAIVILVSEAHRKEAPRSGYPRCQDVERKVRELNPQLTRRSPLSARAVSAVAAQCGVTTESGHRPTFGPKALERIALMQSRYGVDLGVVVSDKTKSGSHR